LLELAVYCISIERLHLDALLPGVLLARLLKLLFLGGKPLDDFLYCDPLRLFETKLTLAALRRRS
jgi:hypothetical protein